MDEAFAETFSCSAPPHTLRCVHCTSPRNCSTVLKPRPNCTLCGLRSSTSISISIGAPCSSGLSTLMDQFFPLDGDRAKGRLGAWMQLKRRDRRVRLLVDHGVGHDVRTGIGG